MDQKTGRKVLTVRLFPKGFLRVYFYPLQPPVAGHIMLVPARFVTIPDYILQNIYVTLSHTH